MAMLKRSKTTQLADLDGGALAKAVDALRDAGHQVTAEETREGEARRRLEAAQHDVPFNLALVATGELPATAGDKARSDRDKARKEWEAARERLDDARAVLTALEEHEGVSLEAARKAAKQHFDAQVRKATQKAVTATEQARDAHDELRRVYAECDAIGVRPCHPNLQALAQLRGAVKHGQMPAGQRHGQLVLIESPVSAWLEKARDEGYKVGPRFPKR